MKAFIILVMSIFSISAFGMDQDQNDSYALGSYTVHEVETLKMSGEFLQSTIRREVTESSNVQKVLTVTITITDHSRGGEVRVSEKRIAFEDFLSPSKLQSGVDNCGKHSDALTPQKITVPAGTFKTCMVREEDPIKVTHYAVVPFQTVLEVEAYLISKLVDYEFKNIKD